MSYEELYYVLSLLTGMTQAELDRLDQEDLELAIDFARKAATKWLNLRGQRGH